MLGEQPACDDPPPDLGVHWVAFMRFPDIGVFVPATDVENGLIRVTGNEHSFRRGDGNSDGNIDLSDALTTLNFLFLGGPRPGCMDAADADDSGRLELTDAVFHLNALFLGAGRVPEPWPACGADPTQDGLGCVASDC